MTHCRRPTGDKFVILNESITVWRDLVWSGVEGCHLDAPSEFRGVSARFNCQLPGHQLEAKLGRAQVPYATFVERSESIHLKPEKP